MTADIVPAATDRPRLSSVMLVLAVIVAALSAFGSPPINGISVLAVVFVAAALLLRSTIEAER